MAENAFGEKVATGVYFYTTQSRRFHRYTQTVDTEIAHRPVLSETRINADDTSARAIMHYAYGRVPPQNCPTTSKIVRSRANLLPVNDRVAAETFKGFERGFKQSARERALKGILEVLTTPINSRMQRLSSKPTLETIDDLDRLALLHTALRSSQKRSTTSHRC